MNQGLFLKYSFSMTYKKGCSPGGITCQAQMTDNQLFVLFYFVSICFLLVFYWFFIGFLLVFYWFFIGFLLVFKLLFFSVLHEEKQII